VIKGDFYMLNGFRLFIILIVFIIYLYPDQPHQWVISIVDETIAKTSTNPKHQGKPWINDDCKDAITNRKNG
jgi:hypothetical protein